eukprot:jgi/Mesen1/3815/ME000207S02829
MRGVASGGMSAKEGPQALKPPLGQPSRSSAPPFGRPGLRLPAGPEVNRASRVKQVNRVNQANRVRQEPPGGPQEVGAAAATGSGTAGSLPLGLPQFVARSELTAIRSRLNRKLSEANAYNRHLLRELQEREAALKECKLDLLALDSDLKELAGVAKEAALHGTKPVTKKINGRYLHSHLAFRLEEVHASVKARLAGVDRMQLREVPLVYSGMAQIKFLVDGDWRLVPDWPSVGDGLSANNLLVVD